MGLSFGIWDSRSTGWPNERIPVSPKSTPKQRRGRFRFTREYGTRPRRCEEPLLIASPLVRALQCGKAILAERLRVIFFDHHEGLAALNEPPEDRVVDGAACLDGF